MHEQVIMLWGFYSIPLSESFGPAMLFSMFPVFNVLTAVITELHTGLMRYFTWLAYLMAFIGLVQFNQQIDPNYFCLGNIAAFITYCATAILGYYIAKKYG